LKMELIEGSETSANHNRTSGKYPKEYIQDSKQGESLKSRKAISLSQSHECEESRTEFVFTLLTSVLTYDIFLCSLTYSLALLYTELSDPGLTTGL